ncbi:MAG: CoA transferase, partial [Planctomycetota bacterium]
IWGSFPLEAGEVRLPGTLFSSKGGSLPPPGLSQHSEEVLLRLGYTLEEIQRFREENVI